MVTTPDRLAKDNSRVKLRHLDEKEMTAQRNRVERFRRSSEKRVDGSAGANSQANVRGEIRRRSESSSTRTHLRSEGDGTAKRGRQGDSSPVDNRGQRSLGRGASRLKSGADVETADVTQGQRSRNWERNRTTRENQSAFSTERREQSRSRAGSTDSPNTRTYRSSRGSATFRQQTSGATARVQQGNNATSSTAPRTNYHVMRSPSISGSNARVQHRSPQTRTYTPSRGGQQAARIRSSQRSSGGGAGWNGGSQSRSRSMSSGNWSGGGSRSFSAGGRGSRSFSGGGRGGGGGGGGHGGHGGRGRR